MTIESGTHPLHVRIFKKQIFKCIWIIVIKRHRLTCERLMDTFIDAESEDHFSKKFIIQ